MRTPAGRRRSIGVALVLALSACTGNGSPNVVAGSIPRCDDIPRIFAAPELYRDDPIYVANEMPTGAVRAWAMGKPGYQDIWIDRDHHGWVTVAFTGDVEAVQAELAAAFPGEGVVAVSVDWTADALESLRERAVRDGQPFVQGAGVMVDHGVVNLMVGVLKPETVAGIESKFAGEPVCISGIDPDDVPPDGPQPQSGSGWRLIADQDEVGRPYDTGIAADQAGLEALWAEVGLSGTPPAVDFQSEVAVFFGQVHGSSCPRLRLDDVRVDVGFVFGVVTRFEAGACTADAIGHAYVVALERSRLPAGPFTIQLEEGERPAGAIEEELTIVDADLSQPGSTFTSDQLHTPPPVDPRTFVESGGFIEPEFPAFYRLDTSCGIEWLGEMNDVWWRTRPGEPTTVPEAWRAVTGEDGVVELELTMTLYPKLRLDALAGGGLIIYMPSVEPGSLCP